jgi:phosphoribosylaminoimidazole-succinocarboxamide synthase
MKPNEQRGARSMARRMIPALLALGLAGLAQGFDGFGTRERLHAPLGPLAEKALQKLAESAAPLERDLLDKHMTGVLKKMNLTTDERAALEREAEKTIDEAVEAWKKRVAACLRPILPKYGNDNSQAARVGLWKKEQLVPEYLVTGWTMPEWMPRWEKAVETHLGAERAATWKKAREANRAAFLPRIEKVLEKWAETGRRRMEETLRADMPVLRQAAKLDMKGEAELMFAAKKLVDAHARTETAAGREMLLNAPDSTIELFLNGRTLNSRFLQPGKDELDKAWRAALAPLVGADALAAMDKAREEKKTLLDEKMAVVLQRSEQHARSEMERQLKAEADGLVSALALDEKRRKELDTLSGRVLDAAMEDVTRKLEESLQSRTVFSDSMILSAGGMERATEHEVWTTGLAELFSAEELQRVKDLVTGRQTRRQMALARVALAEADRVLGLTAAQRARLEPLVARQMGDAFITEDTERYWRIEPHQLMLKAAGVPAAEVEDLFDEEQMRLWKNPPRASGSTTSSSRPSPVAVRDEDAGDVTELPDIDAEISRHLHDRAQKARAQALEHMSFQVADARRQLRLTPEAARRLTTAAKGAVEAAMAAWRDNMDRWAHDNMRHATPRTVKAFVANLGNGGYTLRADEAPRQPLWTQALDALLSPGQRAAWKKITEEREDYRVGAMAVMTTLELDRRRKLNGDQFARIEKLVASVIRAHLPDIERSRSSSPWHLSYYSCLMPLAGVEEKALRAILTAKQWEDYQQNDMDDAQRYWQSVEMWRKMRLNPEEFIR